jgi:hypothetical protein
LAVDQPAEVEHLIVREVLDEGCIRQRRGQVDVKVVEPMRTDRNSEAGGHRGDTPKLGDAATNRRVRLQDSGGVLFQELLKAPAAGLNLAGRHGHGGVLDQARVVVDVVDRKRFLDPVGIVGLVAAHEFERGGQVAPGVVGVEHEQNLGIEHLARRGDAALLLFGREPADLHLDRRKTLVRIAG